MFQFLYRFHGVLGLNVNLKFPEILGSTTGTDLCLTCCSILINCRIKLFISGGHRIIDIFTLEQLCINGLLWAGC